MTQDLKIDLQTNIKLHFIIMKWGSGYLGISKELGFVEEWDTYKEVEEHLINGAIATFKIIGENPDFIKKVFNNPPLKYLLLYYISPFLFSMGKIVIFFSRDTRTLLHA